MKVLMYSLLFTVTKSQSTPDNKTGPSEEPAAKKAKVDSTPDTASQAATSAKNREGVKRNLEFGDEQGGSHQESKRNKGSPTDTEPSPLPTPKPGSSRAISQSVHSEREATGDPTQAKPEVEQQIQTEAGNDINERGTLVGESGNRKVQKEIHWNKQKVSDMSKAFVIGFTKKETPAILAELVDIHYGHTKYQLNSFMLSVKDGQMIEHTFYWIVLKLGFNMSMETLASKFGKPIQAAKYFINRNIDGNIEEDEELITRLKHSLQVMFENDAGMTSFADLLEVEKKRKAYQANSNSGEPSKKRKLNF